MKPPSAPLCSVAPNKRSKSVFIKSAACYRTSMLKDYNKYFLRNGFEVIDDLTKADYIFLITCAFTQHRINEIVDYVGYLKGQKKSAAKIIIAGCLPKIDKGVLAKDDVIQLEGDDSLDALFSFHESIKNIGSRNIFSSGRTLKATPLFRYSHRILESLNAWLRYHIRSALSKEVYIPFHNPYDQFHNPYNSFHDPYDWFYNPDEWFYIVTNTGCTYKCTYCAIRSIVGKPVSKLVEHILKEFRRGLSLGFKKFYLSSDNVGLFRDKNRNFVDLLAAINELEGNFVVKIHHMHPAWLIKNIDSFEDILKKGKVLAVTVPVQSGNDRVLKMMGRQYKSNEVHACFKRLNSRFPFLSVHTQFIVGFPSETEDEFQDSVRFLDGLSINPRFPSAVFEYSDMKGTSSSKYSCKIDPRVKRKRQKTLMHKMRLNKLSKAYSFLKRCL